MTVPCGSRGIGFFDPPSATSSPYWPRKNATISFFRARSDRNRSSSTARLAASSMLQQ